MDGFAVVFVLVVTLLGFTPAEGGAFNISIGTGVTYLSISNPDVIYFGGDVTLTAVDLKKEQIIWNFTVDKYWKSLVQTQNSLIVRGDGIYSLDPDTGKILWHFKLQSKTSVDMAMAIRLASQESLSTPSSAVFVVESPVLFALNLTNGKIVWSALLPNYTGAGSIVASNTTTGVVLRSNHFVYSFDGTGYLQGVLDLDWYVHVFEMTPDFILVANSQDESLQAYDAKEAFAKLWRIALPGPSYQFNDFKMLPGISYLAYVQLTPKKYLAAGPQALYLVHAEYPDPPVWVNNKLDSIVPQTDVDSLVVEDNGNVYWLYGTYLNDTASSVVAHISAKDGKLTKEPTTVPGLIRGVTSDGVIVSTYSAIDWNKRIVFTTIFTSQA